MPLHPALERLIETKLAHTRAPQWELPIAEVRQSFRDLWTPTMTGMPVSLDRVYDVTVPGTDPRIRVRVYTPEQESRCPVMLYFHGGGYVKGGIEDSDTFCRSLAAVTKHMVVSVEYRLAPEHQFPAALDDACTATLWACSHATSCGAPGPVVVCGDAGAPPRSPFRARSDPWVAIRHQVLLQPVVDFALLPRWRCPPPNASCPVKTWRGITRPTRRPRPEGSACFTALANDLSGFPRR
jgi:acetyl esterase